MDSTNKPSPAPTTGRAESTPPGDADYPERGKKLADHIDNEVYEAEKRRQSVTGDYSGLETRALVVLSGGPPAHLSHFTLKHADGVVIGLGCVTSPEVKLYSQADLDMAVLEAVRLERVRLGSKLHKDAEAQQHSHGFSAGSRAAVQTLDRLAVQISAGKY